MTAPPGIRHINPDDEAARLIRERLDPPNREWAIRHPGGEITHELQSRAAAESTRAGADLNCSACGGGTHVLVCRDQQAWREAS